ncbi:type II secretion system F family protein [Sinomonas cellulolyticus]|nr:MULTISPECIES: type II secretion system F family protein [Sinomonas]
MDSPIMLVAGLLAAYAGLIGLVLVFYKSRRTVAPGRRRPAVPQNGSTALAKLTDSAVGAINRSLRGRQLRFIQADKFEQAGVRFSLGDFLIICGAVALVGGILGLVLGGLGLGIVLFLIAPLGPLIWLNLKASKRQAKFADQLPDTLQMLSGSMRAGHSLLRAIDAAAEEAEAPMGEELRRVVNETRIGKDLVDSLLETAGRMKSEDFLWAAQAVETQREVGGNLAEVLENVNDTIRERAQLARQVRALSAEGRMSALILVSLPIVLLVLVSATNRYYAATFFTTAPGWLMLGMIAILLTIGSIWLSILIKPKF